MTDRQRKLSLGIFAVLALILLATLIVSFSSVPELFRRTNSYTVTFKDAPNVRPGTPVRLSGIRVGEVKDISLDDAKGEAQVHIEIEKKYTVRQNEEPKLIIPVIGNDVSIDFKPKKIVPPELPDTDPIPPGSVLQGTVEPTVNTLITRAAEVVPPTQELLNDMRKSLQRFEEVVQPTKDALEEYRKLGNTANAQLPDLAKSLKGSSDDFGATAREWRKLGENLNVLLLANQDKLVKALDNVNLVLDRVLSVLSEGNIKDVTAIIQNLRDISGRAVGITRNVQDASEHFPSIAKNTDDLVKESQKTLKRLQVTLDKADAAMADVQKLSQQFGERGPSIAKNLDESMDKLNRTMTDVRELMRVIGQSDGTFKRILTDPSLYNNVDQTACALAKLMPRLDRILKDLETFADKLARHPELIGVSGTINKSNGLKDPEPINPQHIPH
jgi:phospholipid/cholesterol/gamma-HCH transport system substrate-binding protein